MDNVLKWIHKVMYSAEVGQNGIKGASETFEMILYLPSQTGDRENMKQ